MLIEKITAAFDFYNLSNQSIAKIPLFSRAVGDPTLYIEDLPSFQEILDTRPKLLVAKYLSDKPYAKAKIISTIIEQELVNHPLKRVFDLALSSIIVPISNIRYGPGFGVGKIKDDADVLTAFKAKLKRMISDFEGVTTQQKATPSSVYLGDARALTNCFEPNSAALMVTSPPYPGDHEYTKHTKLELLFSQYVDTLEDFRVIKKRMLRASTTNLYREDNDSNQIRDLESIQAVTKEIDQRLKDDNATSGFEKLYTKLVWEYFGGMYKALGECITVLRPGGKIALLVSDSHAFKMVHIETAAILSEIGLMAGYINPEIVLWQNKTSTSHTYNLRENILFLQKPF